jgi:isopentenyl-diphosphate delta-isomerase
MRNFVRSSTSRRKLSHIRISLCKKVRSQREAGFEDVHLVHRALPEINAREISLESDMFGRMVSAPLIIESMTGGVPSAAKINAKLARIAQELRIGMGLGSQRAAIEEKSLAYTYRIARENAPDVPIFANIGCPQISNKDAIKIAQEAVDMIEADGLFIHLNTLQESIQPEGQTDFKGILTRIKEITNGLSVPVLVKETGAGICKETAIQLENVGVKGIDVSGVGGTSWAAVEYYRSPQQTLGKIFWDWGIPTVASIVEVSRSTKVKVFASGGIRNGLHLAKSLALGAHYGGIALPILHWIMKGEKYARKELVRIIQELRATMFLVGALNIEAMRNAPIIITGFLREWLDQRGFETTSYAKRKLY